jgi:O-antigen/teichoic acid export membrane protein
MSASPLLITPRTLAGSITALFTGSLIAQATTALSSLIIARHLEPTIYGQFSASFVLAAVTSTVFNLGLDLWLLREGSRREIPLNHLTASVLTIKLLAGVPWLVLLVSLAPRLFPQTYLAGLLLWSAAAVGLDSLFSTILYSFKATLRNRLASILEASCDLLWFGGVLILVSEKITAPQAFAQIRFLALFVFLIIAILFVFRSHGLQFSSAVSRKAIRSAPPYAVSELLASATSRLDIIIVSFVLGGVAVGLYSPAINLMNAAYLAPTAVHIVMVPVLSSLFLKNPGRAVRASQLTIAGLLVVGVFLSALFALTAPLMVWLLGESYQPSLPLLRILSLILIFKSGSFAVAAILVATGNQAKRSLAQAAAVVFNLVMNLLVIQRYGLIGIAWVYVFTEVILFAGYTYLMLRERCLAVSPDKILPKI